MRVIGYWAVALLMSAIAVAVIAHIWGRVDRSMAPGFEIVETPESVEAFIDRNVAEESNAPFDEGSFLRVPTGFFIQAMAFTSSANVNVNGYVWQKFPPDYPYDRGVVFPEEFNSVNTVIAEAWRETVVHDGVPHELIGWYFDVTLRQSFNYRRYPLDFLTIWLRLWSEDPAAAKHVLFVPDFDSYVRADHSRFGLDQDIVSGEWVIAESFFSYRDVPYDTRFGFDLDDAMTEPDVRSEFYFNLGADRNFVNAFIVNLVPLFVVALLLFAALMTVSSEREQSERFGFSASGLLGTCSALFFVVMLSHIQVRGSFPGANLVYIEYFFLVMYGAILLTAVNAYLVSMKSLAGWRLLHWRDNLLPKLLFWPSLLWAMVVISIAVL